MIFRTSYLAAMALSLGIYGCGAPSDSPPAAQPAPPTSSDQEALGEHDHNEHGDHGEHTQSDMEKMKAELAKLSPADTASAEKQHFCPVSGEMLGTMGAPIKVEVKGQSVWICCEGCRKQLLENPDEYLAKLQN